MKESGWIGRTAQVPSEHEIQHKKAVLIVLESIAHIDHESMVYLFAKDLCER